MLQEKMNKKLTKQAKKGSIVSIRQRDRCKASDVIGNFELLPRAHHSETDEKTTVKSFAFIVAILSNIRKKIIQNVEDYMFCAKYCPFTLKNPLFIEKILVLVAQDELEFSGGLDGLKASVCQSSCVDSLQVLGEANFQLKIFSGRDLVSLNETFLNVNITRLESLRRTFDSVSILNNATDDSISDSDCSDKPMKRKLETDEPEPESKSSTSISHFESRYSLLPDLIIPPPLLPGLGFPASELIDFHQLARFHFRLLSIDCEMSMTNKSRLDVTRLSMILTDCDFNRTDYCYDKFVVPDDPIVDYLTQFSGVTPDCLSKDALASGKAVRKADAVAEVSQWLTQAFCSCASDTSCKTILIGHSLENDLTALGIGYNLIIDTSIIFPISGSDVSTIYSSSSQRHALRYLAKKFLNRGIQQGMHDSVEDSLAVFDLVKMKLARGLNFGCVQEISLLSSSVMDGCKICVICDMQKHNKLLPLNCKADIVQIQSLSSSSSSRQVPEADIVFAFGSTTELSSIPWTSVMSVQSSLFVIMLQQIGLNQAEESARIRGMRLGEGKFRNNPSVQAWTNGDNEEFKRVCKVASTGNGKTFTLTRHV